MSVQESCCDAAEQAVRDLSRFGIEVEGREELLRTLSDCPDLPVLLRGAANLILNWFPDARLTLRWYEDPENLSDRHPWLAVSLPGQDKERVRNLLRVLDDANLVLLTASCWTFAALDSDEGFLYADLDEDLDWSDS